jgi:WD40 repeat protein
LMVLEPQASMIWSPELSKSLERVERGVAFPQLASINPSGNGAVILPFNSQKVIYIDLRTGKFHVTGSGSVAGVLFTRDRLLIQRTSGTLEIWDSNGRHLLGSLPGAGGFTEALAASPNGTVVARVRDNGTVLITALTTGQALGSFSLPFPNTGAADPWRATALQFTPDGKALLTAASGGEMMRWDLYPPDLVKIACATVGRALTATEWRTYVHTNPPADLACRP